MPSLASFSAERLVLGTAQLGMDYGVANTTGQPAEEMARSIVQAAWTGGVREFDTAQGYGESEAVLGRVFDVFGIASRVGIMTKPAAGLAYSMPGELESSLESSRQRLGVPRLQSVMLHSEKLLDQWETVLGPLFSELRAKDIVTCAGVSVYSPESALRALEINGIDAVQLPSSPLDRRFELAGVYERASELGKTLYVRSIYLQGLLLMDPEALPAYVAHAKEPLIEFRALAKSFEMSPAGLALAYVRDAYPDTKILFGAETSQQVEENLLLWQAAAPEGVVEAIRTAFAAVPEKVLNPTRW